MATYEKNPFYWAGNASNYPYENTVTLLKSGTTIKDTPLGKNIVSQAIRWVAGGDALVKNMPTYTPDSHILTWTISLNQRGANLGTVQVKDWLPQGVSYVDGSAKVDGVPIEVSQINGNGIVFQIEQVTNAKTLTYQTEVSETVLKAKRKVSLTNQAQLYIWEDNKWQDTILPNDAKRKKTVTIDQPVITKEAMVGKENGSNKIDYRIEINPSGVDLLNGQEENVWLLDELGDGLILNEDSIQLYEANVSNQNGSLVLSKGQLKADTQISVDSVYHTFTVILPKSNQPYILTYTTYATRLKNLSNRVSLQGVQAWEQDWQSLEANTLTNISNAGGGGTLPPKNMYISLCIQKVDQTSGKPLSGAEIGLYWNKYDETSMLTSGITDENGLCVLSVKKKLLQNIDMLYYKELNAPDGYKQDVHWYGISINEIQDTPIRFENEPMEQGREAHITLEVYDVLTEEPVPMAEFALYKYEDDKEPFMVRQTNIFGTLTFDNLVEGHEYFIRLVDMPEEYHLDKKEGSVGAVTDDTIVVEIPAQVGSDGGDDGDDGGQNPPDEGDGEGTPLMAETMESRILPTAETVKEPHQMAGTMENRILPTAEMVKELHQMAGTMGSRILPTAETVKEPHQTVETMGNRIPPTTETVKEPHQMAGTMGSRIPPTVETMGNRIPQMRRTVEKSHPITVMMTKVPQRREPMGSFHQMLGQIH